MLLSDQFETEENELKKPELICIPCTKNDSPIKNRPDFILKLYKIKHAKHEKREVLVTDQFGEEILEVKKPKYLAVPALKQELPE